MSADWIQRGKVAWRFLLRAVARFEQIDGNQRGAAFAYYAFFSLFPLILVFVAVGSLFVDRDRAVNAVIGYLGSYVPLSAGMRRNVFDVISGVVRARGQAGVIATLVLFWSALRFFNALIRAVNRAWGGEIPNWWRMPLKCALLLAVLASALLLGMGLPVLGELVRRRIPSDWTWIAWITRLADFTLSAIVFFYGLSLFYKLAPRRTPKFAEVWPAALFTAVFLRILESFFVAYVRNFGHFNAVYGALGGIMALLLWIYLSGCILIFGACLCAARQGGEANDIRLPAHTGIK